MFLKAFVSVVVCMWVLPCLVPHAHGQQASTSARLFDLHGDIPCDDTLARLDALAQELKSSPMVKVHVIGYGGVSSGSGRVQHRLSHVARYIIGTHGIDSSRVFMTNAGRQGLEELKIEFWIMPEGATPPELPPAAPAGVEDSTAREYDEGYLDFVRYEGKYQLACCDICELEMPDIRAYVGAVRKADAQAYVILYLGLDLETNSVVDRRRGGFRKMEEIFKRMLVKVYGLDANRITIAYGGGRAHRMVELWIVPRGAPAPKATPTHTSKRRKR